MIKVWMHHDNNLSILGCEAFIFNLLNFLFKYLRLFYSRDWSRSFFSLNNLSSVKRSKPQPQRTSKVIVDSGSAAVSCMTSNSLSPRHGQPYKIIRLQITNFVVIFTIIFLPALLHDPYFCTDRDRVSDSYRFVIAIVSGVIQSLYIHHFGV